MNLERQAALIEAPGLGATQDLAQEAVNISPSLVNVVLVNVVLAKAIAKTTGGLAFFCDVAGTAFAEKPATKAQDQDLHDGHR